MPGRGGGRSKSSGGKGGVGRPPPSRDETVSRAMSYVLRHGAEKEKLKLDEGGYINCADLVSACFCSEDIVSSLNSSSLPLPSP